MRLPHFFLLKLSLLALLFTIIGCQSDTAAPEPPPSPEPSPMPTVVPTPLALTYGNYEPVPLTAEQAAEDLTILRQALEEIHPGYTRYTSTAELDTIWEQMAVNTAEGSTDVDLYRDVSLLLGAIRCDHTKADFPADFQAFRERNKTHLPFRFKLFNGRMYIVSADSNQADLLPVGAEVLRINDTAVSEIITTLEPLVSVDGYTDHVKSHILATDGDLMGSSFDQFYPLFYGIPDSYSLVLQTAAGDTIQSEVRPLNFTAWQRLDWPQPYRADFVNSVTVEQLDGQTAVLDIDTFVNYRQPVDPVQLYAGIFAELNANGTEHLILDLRDSGGGSDDAAVNLARFILDEPFTFMRPIQIKTNQISDDLWPYINTWDANLIKEQIGQTTALPNGQYEVNPELTALSTLPLEPHPDRFLGEITILIGPANASGATHLLAKLQESERVTLVGSATGGSAEGATAGQILFVELPHSGISVRVPLMRQYMNIDSFELGLGVRPDVLVEQSAAQFFAGEDVVLTAALNR